MTQTSRYAGRFAVVVNGKARRVTQELVSVIDELVKNGDLFVSRSLEEGKEIAETIVRRGYPIVLAGGGDGTFVHTVTWVMEAALARSVPPPRFGLLRLGTGNALAWVLGASQKQPKLALEDIDRTAREGGKSQLRMLVVEGVITPFAGIGTEASILKHYGEVKDVLSHIPVMRMFAEGRSAYALAMLTRSVPAHLFERRPRVRIINEGKAAYRLGPNGQPLGPVINRGEPLFEGRTRLVSMSTIPFWGFGVRAFPFANEREDRFNLRVIDLHLHDGFHARQIWKGTYRNPRFQDYLAEKVTIECDDPTLLQIGGDVVGKRKTIQAELYETSIPVIDYYSPPLSSV